MWLTQVIGSGISLVGRSPWTAADALVRLLAGRPGGRPRARAPVPHSSPERGLPESSTYPVNSKSPAGAMTDHFYSLSPTRSSAPGVPNPVFRALDPPLS